MNMPVLTIFTAPKPFTHPHIVTIQRNAIRSWVELGSEVEVFLIGEEEGMAQAASELEVRHLPQVVCNSRGTPLISSIFDLARRHAAGQLLAYVNADILLLPDFLAAARQAARLAEQFLLVGQRWDLDVLQALDFSDGWQERLGQQVQSAGKLHPRGGSDYFIYPRACFEQVPDFAVGRAGWDNWMIYEARRRGWPCADATPSIRVIHQSHDYSHLPGGQPHYRLPETFENVRLAGGRRTIFTLQDADRQLVDGRLLPMPHTWGGFWRSVETFPLLRMGSYPLAQAAFAVFHPQKAYAELRAWRRVRKNA
jgi:hypothetical protein